jgi:type II secretory pathway pseudopilin PulG
LETDPNRENKQAEGNQPPLSGGEGAPAHPNEDSGQPSVPAAPEEKIAAGFQQQASSPETSDRRKPLQVEVIEDDELSRFEGLTIRFGKVGLVISALALLAATLAAYYVFQQFKEMSAQTELLSRAARQARRDSAQASVAVTKQLEIAQLQTSAAQESVEVLRDQLAVTDRAWIKVEATPVAPLSFDKNGRGNLSVAFVMKNVGHSVASNVYLRERVDAIGVTDDPNIAIRKQREFCGGKSSTDKNAAKSELSFAIFPNDSANEPRTMVLDTKNVKDETPKGVHLTLGKPVLPFVVGCVNYEYGGSPKAHQTGFIFGVYAGNKGQMNGFPFMQGVQILDTIPVDKLALSPYWLGHNYAY